MTELQYTAGGVPFLRSPDSAFDNLPDYGFAPHYMTFEGLRMHYVDEGPRDGPVALLMHGMPTWSFHADLEFFESQDHRRAGR
ncbi:MAG: hypothetical protein RLZZ141_2115 [Pseudomonadota bacterium]